MAKMSLQFHGITNVAILTTVGLAVAAALLVHGTGELIREKKRRGSVEILLGISAAAAVILATVFVPLDKPSRQFLWIITLGLIISAAVAAFYSAVYSYLGKRRITTLLVLRSLAILALLTILFKPALSVQPDEQSRLTLPVIIDRSASMSVKDTSDLPDRYHQAIEALSAQADRINKKFNVEWFHFARQCRQVDNIDELASLSPTGDDTDLTDIAGAIRRALQGRDATRLAGCILISDGLHNAPDDVVEAAGESPVGIFALAVGSLTEKAATRRNVRLISTDAPLEAIANNITTITATVQLTGWAGIPTKVSLREGEKQIASKQLLTSRNNQTKKVQFRWTPASLTDKTDRADIRKLKIVVEPNPAEATTKDNSTEIHVLVTSPRIRVLYVEGTLRTEYKFLQRILASDPNIQCISLVRISDNRFLSKGSINGVKLSRLPKTEKEFAMFDVFIIGDLDSTFLTREQMEIIRKLVNDGKALLMLGGHNSFGPGGYGGTPIESALPVFCGGRNQKQETTPFIPKLTSAGLVSPIASGLEKYFHTPTSAPKVSIPKLSGCVIVPAAKPAASILAIHPTRRNAAGPLIVLAVEQYGAGRSAAFTADTTWRWYLKLRTMGKMSPYHIFWAQLIRYLAGIKHEPTTHPSVLARISQSYLQQGKEIKITAQVKGTDGQPVNDATVVAELRPISADGKPQPMKITLTPAAQDGIYRLHCKPKRSGKYRLIVTAKDRNGEIIGEDRLPLFVAERSKEMDRLARNDETLKTIVAESHGKFAELSALPEILDKIINQYTRGPAVQAESKQYNLYNFTLLFIIFVVLLTAEWALRRNWQLQ